MALAMLLCDSRWGRAMHASQSPFYLYTIVILLDSRVVQKSLSLVCMGGRKESRG